MLVIRRNFKEWVQIGENFYILVDKIRLEGKHQGKLRIKIFEMNGHRKKEYNKYLTYNEPLSLNKDITVTYGGKSGRFQYKLAIDAPKEYEIHRHDEEFVIEDNSTVKSKKDDLVERYQDELSWFFNLA